jgi:hypothetical protein
MNNEPEAIEDMNGSIFCMTKAELYSIQGRMEELEAENTRLRADCCVMWEAIGKHNREYNHGDDCDEYDGDEFSAVSCTCCKRPLLEARSQVAHYPKP